MDENKKEKMNKKTLILNIVLCTLISILLTVILATYIREGLYTIVVNAIMNSKSDLNKLSLVDILFKISLLITFALSLYISLKLRLKQKND